MKKDQNLCSGGILNIHIIPFCSAVIFLLLSHVKLYYFRPTYPVEELEEETVAEDDAELTLNKVDEEFVVCVLLNFLFIFTVGSFPLILLDFHFLEYILFHCF